MRARFRKRNLAHSFLSICAQLAFNVKTTSFGYDLRAGENSGNKSIEGGLFYGNGGERMTMKLRKDSQIPAYMAYPRFLLTMDISETAKLIYVLLLDRARLSMKNEGWEDEQGHVFIYYTIADLASASGRSEMTVKNALAALEQKNLISRKRQGAGLPSKIYVQVQTETCLTGWTSFKPQTDQKLSTSNKQRKTKEKPIRNYDYEEGDSL